MRRPPRIDGAASSPGEARMSETPKTASIALITGGGSGIGAASAEALARDGFAIAVTDIRRDAAESVAKRLPGAGHRAYVLDAGSERDIDTVFAAVEAEMGAVSTIVCCAGIIITPVAGPPALTDMSAADWDKTFAVNTRGVFLCIRAFLRARAKRPVAQGRIIAISSAAAQIGGYRGSADYIASKAAVIALIKIAARQAAGQGITANTIAPGPIDTPMLRLAVPVGAEGPMVSNVPLGRLGRPDEVAAAVSYLASEKAAFVTGATIDVNGGYRMA
jgi:NAD(P)-dependent dehydrogenase (short-subunit alcohol dehydrogenase family)